MNGWIVDSSLWYVFAAVEQIAIKMPDYPSDDLTP